MASAGSSGADLGLVEVWRGAREAEARERALVLIATGLPHELVAGPGGWQLLVPDEAAAAALAQLRRWELENATGTTPPRLRRRSSGLDGAACLTLLLATAWLAQANGAFGLPWEEAGLLDSAAVRGGEAWRAITALTLHADPGHLWSNVGFGALLVGALCWLLGTGAGLLAALLAGGAGNLAAALLRGEGAALGASTAVFAALGALAALAWRRRAAWPAGRWRSATPLLAAVLLLAYLGLEGEKVDALGHVCGLLAGLLLGAALGAGGALREGAALAASLDRAWVQWAAGLLAAGTVAGAWWLALA